MSAELTTGQPDDQAIVDYLLGACSEKAAHQLDELSVTDDETARRIHAIEYELVDSFARGHLTSVQLERFKSHYLASPRRREKVRASESFLAMVDRLAATPEEKPEPSGLQRRVGLLRHVSRFFAVSPLLQWSLITALLLILLTAGYLLFENQALRKEAALAGSERAALEERSGELERRLAEQRSGDLETEKELAHVRERLAQVEQELGAARGQKGSPGQPRVVALSLVPQSRGIGQIPALVVYPEADYVALTLELQAEGFAAYQAALKDPATGKIIWRSGRIKSSGKSSAIRVSFRASLLNSQNYVLDLSGTSPNGVAENVGSYAFRVVRK